MDSCNICMHNHSRISIQNDPEDAEIDTTLIKSYLKVDFISFCTASIYASHRFEVFYCLL